MSKKNKANSAEMPISPSITRTIEWDIQAQTPVENAQEKILEVEGLKMYFPVTRGLLKRQVGAVKAVDDVSFVIKKGETLGLVGESGSGKSTIGNCVVRNYKATDGVVRFNGENLADVKGAHLKEVRQSLQMITQDPFASLNPKMQVRDIILEGVRIHKLCERRDEDALVERMMMLVGLNPKFASRYPHEFSGGQRQRISIARALALNPSFIVCDEIVSALDVSIQAQIVNLMSRIQQELQVAYLFIGHDLSVVRHISHKVAVLYLGKIMEYTSSDELYAHPLHPYTQALVSAVPVPDPVVDRARERIILEGEIPSPLNPPKGCNFCTRCKYADERCRTEEPALTCVGADHYVACHKVAER
jgi:oligopeptide transport system ATP-binding protein